MPWKGPVRVRQRIQLLGRKVISVDHPASHCGGEVHAFTGNCAPRSQTLKRHGTFGLIKVSYNEC